MKNIIIVLFTVVAMGGFQVLCAQEAAQQVNETPDEEGIVEPVKNVIYFELFGNGGVYSFNYERRVASSVWIRGGISNFSLFGDYITIPLTANYLFGSSTVTFETGAGVTFIYGEWSRKFFRSAEEESDTIKGLGFNATGTVGLRFQPDTHNLFMKLAFTPFYNRAGFIPFAGFSMGYSF
jgi:hypothetical protein